MGLRRRSRARMSYEHFEGRSSPEIASDDRAALQRFPAKYRSNRIRDHSRAALDLTGRAPF
jgi:hypothetical protein